MGIIENMTNLENDQNYPSMYFWIGHYTSVFKKEMWDNIVQIKVHILCWHYNDCDLTWGRLNLEINIMQSLNPTTHIKVENNLTAPFITETKACFWVCVLVNMPHAHTYCMHLHMCVQTYRVRKNGTDRRADGQPEKWKRLLRDCYTPHHHSATLHGLSPQWPLPERVHDGANL